MNISDGMCNTPEAIEICKRCHLRECVDIEHLACPLRQYFEGQEETTGEATKEKAQVYDASIIYGITFENEVRRAVAMCRNS